MSPMNDSFELRIDIQPVDFDQLGHVNNVVYLRWVQDAAIAHWQAVASARAQEALVWVVARHEIDYKRPAVPGDEVLARTWVGTATRRAFKRHTEIVRVADGRVLARALTVWCPLDPETGRPTDVAPEIRMQFSVSEQSAG